MAQPIPAKPKTRQEKEALQKAARRAEQANILAGTRPLLEKDEQLLAFARARIAGGWKSKLNVGPEAFFAPFVNVALTERRFLVQHVQHTTGRPGQMLPHAYTFDKIARVTFTDIETYGGELACRLILHLENGLYVRLRLRGQSNFAGARNMAELFDSLTTARRKTPLSPTHSLCPQCDHVLEQPYKFCPYCGTEQPPRASNVQADAETPTLAHTGITIATPDEAPLAEAIVGVLPTASPTGQPAFGGIGEMDTPEMTIARETDFAYERDDRPAEFGFALPTAAIETEELEGMEPEGIENEDQKNASGETPQDGIGEVADEFGITVGANEAFGVAANDMDAQNDADFAALANDDLFTPTDEAEQPTGNSPQRAEPEVSGVAASPANTDSADIASADTAAYDDMFAPDEPVQTQSGAADYIQPGGVAFEQYDMQAFGDLPFSDTPDAEFPVPPSAGLESQDDDNAVVRDDTTEAFLPRPQNGAANADAALDAFSADGGSPTGDDNADFNTGAENVPDAASPASAVPIDAGQSGVPDPSREPTRSLEKTQEKTQNTEETA